MTTNLSPLDLLLPDLPKLPNGDLEVQVPLKKETCETLRRCVIEGQENGYLIGTWASVAGAERRERKDRFGLLDWFGWRRWKMRVK